MSCTPVVRRDRVPVADPTEGARRRVPTVAGAPVHSPRWRQPRSIDLVDASLTRRRARVHGRAAGRPASASRAARSGRPLVAAIVRRHPLAPRVAGARSCSPACIVVATPLLLVPGLDWGWWSALGGEGNPVFGSSTTTAGTVLGVADPAGVRAPCSCLRCRCSPTPRSACSAPARRAGAGGGGRSRSLQFGLVHALIGIPIGAALALSVGGAYFMASTSAAFAPDRLAQRRRRSSRHRAHTAYNACHHRASCIVAIVLTAVVDDRLDRRRPSSSTSRSTATESVTDHLRRRRWSSTFPVERAARGLPVRRRAAACASAASWRGRDPAQPRAITIRRRRAERRVGPVDRLERRPQTPGSTPGRCCAGGGTPGCDRPLVDRPDARADLGRRRRSVEPATHEPRSAVPLPQPPT